MSEEVGEAILRIRTDESGVDFKGAGRRAGKEYGGAFLGISKGLIGAAAGLFAVDKIVDFSKESIEEAREAQKVNAATTATIKATGGVANVSAKEVAELAEAQSRKTGVDQETIKSGENLLLTFNHVRNEVGKGNDIFNQATKAAQDLSAAGFGDLHGTSIQLGKALQDPLKGINALARSGVSFDQATKDQIKSLVAQNNLLGAQKLILAGVEGQVGGVAAATATAGEKAKASYVELKESVGNLLTPAIDAAADLFTKHLAPSIQDGIDALPGVGRAFKRVGGFVGSTFDDLKKRLSTGPGGGIFGQLKTDAKEVIPLVVGFVQGRLIPAFQSVLKQVGPVLAFVAKQLSTVVLPAVRSVVIYVARALGPVFTDIVRLIKTSLVPAFSDIEHFIYGALLPAVLQAGKSLKPVFDTLVRVIRTVIIPTIAAAIQQIRTQLLPVLEPLILQIVKIAGVLLRVLGPPILVIAGFLFKNLVPALISTITYFLKGALFGVRLVETLVRLAGAFGRGVAAATGFASAIGQRVGGALRTVLSAIASVPGRIFALGEKFGAAGRHLITSLIHGLSNAGGFVKDFAGNVWKVVKRMLNAAIDRINDALDFSVPIGFGKTVHVNVKNIPHLARGTGYFQGGLALVGEQGPEIAALPRGSQVIPARQSAAAMAGGGVYVDKLVAHDYHDFERQIGERQALSALGGRRLAG